MNVTAITRTVGRAVLTAKKNSPTIMFVAGLVGVGTSTVLACRATLKVEDVLAETSLGLGKVSMVRSEVIELGVEDSTYSERDALRDKSILYVDLVVQLTKLYGPAIIVGGIGVACLTGSHNILVKRNAAITAAYVALEKTYYAYRDRIRTEIGEEKEAQLHYEVQKSIAESDKKELQLLGKKETDVVPGYSRYAKFFDECSKSWSRSPEKNLWFIHCQQDWANDLLHSRGHVFLNEVYDMLGLPRTEAGAVVGWTMWGEGDQYIDFGIFNHHTDEVRAFVNGVENSILLDFNVDGLIYDKIER